MRFSLLIIFVFILSCTTNIYEKEVKKLSIKNVFSNKGFTLIYSDDLKKKKIISNKLDNRSLKIFQKNIKKNTKVKITNLINDKYIIVEVDKKSDYPPFYNSVITSRIANEIELDLEEPYIEILEVNEDSMFVANKAITFEEEKKVADKAPVEDITIKTIDNNQVESKKIDIKKSFKYIIKVADFYYIDSAKMLKNRIVNDTKSDTPKIEKLSKTKFRVYLGPFLNITSLKNAFNDISKLKFENIEIIKL